MTNTWILTTDERIANLVEAAAAIGGTTTVIAVAPTAPAVGNVDKLIHVPTAENVPAEAYAGVVAGLLADAKGDVILAANRPAERSFAGAAAAALALPVVVGATHLTTKQPDNRKQLRRLEDFMARVARRRGIPDAPRIVLGDLNTHLEDIQKQTEYEVLAQALTYPDDEPSSQIDHILGVGFRAAGEATTRRLAVSDHRMLAVDVD